MNKIYDKTVLNELSLIAGKNPANPIAIIFSNAMLLNHIGQKDKAVSIINAVTKTIYEDKILTCDLGGKATTDEITEAIFKNII